MSRPPIPDDIRRAAIEDYRRTDDTQAAVAARHGIPRSTFAGWVSKRDREQRGLPPGTWVPNGRGTVVWVRA